MAGGFIRRINASVLSPGTTEADHQMLKSPVYIIFHRYVNNIKNTVQKLRHPGLLLQIVLHFFVPAG